MDVFSIKFNEKLNSLLKNHIYLTIISYHIPNSPFFFPENPYFRTLNRKNDQMSTKFPEYKGLDLPKVADEILDFWQQNTIFEKSISERDGAKPFIF